MDMPSKKDYPTYYKEIKRPICIETIFVRANNYSERMLTFTLCTETTETQGIHYARGICQRRRTGLFQRFDIQLGTQSDMGGCRHASGEWNVRVGSD